MTGSDVLRMLLEGTGCMYAEAMAAIGDRQRRIPFYRKGINRDAQDKAQDRRRGVVAVRS